MPNDNRIYGGDPKYVHIPDGQRKAVGANISRLLDREMRSRARASYDTPLCPGCYMVALVNAAVLLADANGQSRSELGRSMSQAFAKLAADPAKGLTEEIEVILDPEVNPLSNLSQEEKDEATRHAMAQAISLALGGPIL